MAATAGQWLCTLANKKSEGRYWFECPIVAYRVDDIYQLCRRLQLLAKLQVTGKIGRCRWHEGFRSDGIFWLQGL